MKWKGQELVEYKTMKDIIFNPPKKMLVWDDNSECFETDVIAVLPSREAHPVIAVRHTWKYCAEIPEEQKPEPQLATIRQLAEWLAKGNGEYRTAYSSDAVYHLMDYSVGEENNIVSNTWNIRKWGDKQWHRPTLEYMGVKE